MRRRRVVLAALLAAACVAAGAAAQGDPQAHHLTHAHHHEGAAGGAPASDVAEYTKAVGVRLQEIHERFFPAEKRKAGMTQAEFAEAAKQMMQTLSTDPLYTANVSAAAGAARPQFDWPWTRNYRVADGYYLHMGWRRANKTFWGTTNRFAVAGTSDWDDRRPHILGEWSDVPQNCSKGSPGFVWTRSWYWPDLIDPDGNAMSLCRGAPPPGTDQPPLPATRHRVTVCIHNVLNINLFAGGNGRSPHIRMRREWLEAFFQHYSGLGVDHFYVHVSRIPFMDIPGYSYDWIDVSWMHAFSDNEYGQIWAINNCLFRNREQGNGWALFVDLDELVTIPGVRDGLRALAGALEARGYESSNFHSVGYISSYCDEAEEAWAGGSRQRGLAERMVFRAEYPESCVDIWQWNCTWMNVLAMGGRRKIFTKVDAALTVEIHALSFVSDEEMDLFLLTRPGVKKGDFNPKMRAMNGTRAWIRHVRGVGFEDVDLSPEARQLCRGAPPQCEHIPGGLRCAHGGAGEAGAVNPTNNWVDERPYRLRAIALGDVLAGSWETVNWGGALRRQ